MLMKTKYLLVLLCALFSQSFQYAAAPAQLFALLLQDNQPKIRKASAHDVRHVKRWLHQVHQMTGITVKTTCLTKHTLSSSAVLRSVDTLPSTQNDIIFVYFSGHGIGHRSAHISLWPCLLFYTNDEVFDSRRIIARVAQKPHALALLLFDCCNIFMPNMAAGTAPIYVRKGTDNGATMLMNTHGIFIGTAAKPGTRSYCTTSGSIFTQHFIDCFNEETTTAHPSWLHIAQKISARCEHIPHSHLCQTPVFEFN